MIKRGMSTEKGEANRADKADTPTASTRDDRTTEGTGTFNLHCSSTQGWTNFSSFVRRHFHHNGGGSNLMPRQQLIKIMVRYNIENKQHD